ncbi:MAG: methyltransferase [Proteobacteria bacterium]|nr:MAG: methyltransferase [Pseudomonadota bacterium]
MENIPFELSSLADAKRYQRWLYESVQPFLGQRILELGSGIGNLSQHLPVRERLILSDIEPGLLEELKRKVPPQPNVTVTQVQVSDQLSETFKAENLDTIVSFNVMEHVENDEALLRDLLKLLSQSNAPGPKRIVTLAPAHQFAFGEIDKQFGHYRRYSSKSFRDLLDRAAGGSRTNFTYRSFYLNLPALLAWWLNGRVRKISQIGSGNMELFEKLCPIIRPIDTFLHRALRLPFGNSLVTIIELRR